nr:HipA domain-containing protein [uncultured Oribacterium sp.]
MSIDFTNCPVNKLLWYGGANGKKIGIQYDNETYMLKLPSFVRNSLKQDNDNSSINEYLSCHIYESLGIDTQKTILGTYKDTLAVACKDFTEDGAALKDFASLKNSILCNSESGYSTELDGILETIQTQEVISCKLLEERFWDMFIVDAFIGNVDRHNGNWGFLINRAKRSIHLAPVYDCGSSLYPNLTEVGMKNILSSEREMNDRIYVFPSSAIQYKDRKINYFEFLNTTDNTACLQALKRIYPRIDMDKINAIIESTPYISGIQKDFYRTILAQRKAKILDSAIERGERK